MKAFLIAGAAALGLAAIAPALAQTPVAPSAAKAAKAHTRGDVQARVAEHFARLDANRDGFLTKAEADAGRAAMRDQLRQRFAQRQGERRDARADSAFERLDANKDGAISRQEFDAGRAHREQRMAGRHGGKAAAMHMRGMRGAGMGAMHGRLFELADGNKDGRVTLQEATATALQHFDTADANRDGQITREERRQMHQKMRSERRPG